VGTRESLLHTRGGETRHVGASSHALSAAPWWLAKTNACAVPTHLEFLDCSDDVVLAHRVRPAAPAPHDGRLQRPQLKHAAIDGPAQHKQGIHRREGGLWSA
jgi:hypothetical protein